MSNYLIKLKPLTPYFFGGENTFGENNKHYFVRSNYLPQQTTLLGFLRYELLRQNNLLGTDAEKHEWKNLIGEKSFQNENGAFTSEFGAIKKISPVFLCNQTENYIPQAMDWCMSSSGHSIVNGCNTESEMLSPLIYSFYNNTDNIYFNNTKSPVPLLTAGTGHYDPKFGLKSLLVEAGGKTKRQWDYEIKFDASKGFQNGLFIPKLQIGITRKLNRTKEDTSDFYKQLFYQLADNHAFAFFAEIDLPDKNYIKSSVVTMGGERSTFEMTVAETQSSFEDTFSFETFTTGHARQCNTIVLTSDCYTETDIFRICDFAISDSVPFRNIRTVSNNANNYIKIRGGNLSKTSQLLTLIKRGSVFYASDLTKLLDAFKNPAFEKIGYNHYVKISN